MRGFFYKWWRKIVALVIVIAVGFGGYYGAKAYISRNTSAQQSSRVVTTVARKGSITVSVNGSGTVEGIAKEDITLSSGTVKKVYFQEGDTVKEGDLMYELENPDLELSEKQAEINLEQAQTSLNNYEDQLSKASVYAPVSGLLTMKVSAGDTVNEGALIASIQNISTLVLPVSIDVKRINDVKVGQNAVLTVNGIEGSISGTIKEVKRDAYVAIISVSNSDGRLRPGMTASAAIKASNGDISGLYGTLDVTTSPIQVKSPMSGTVEAVYDNAGVINVTQGEELVKLDTSDLEKEIAAQRLKIEQTQASIEQLKLNIQQKQSSLADSQKQLSKAVVTAPVAGILTMNVNEGDNVNEGSVVATIQDISVLSLSVPSHNILLPGTLVQVTTENGVSYGGTVKKLQGSTAVIEVSGDTLRPDMNAWVGIYDQKNDQVIIEYGVLSPTVSPTQVKAPFSGSVSQIYVQSDTLVSAGQNILKLDTTSLKNSIASQNLELEQLQNNLNQSESDLAQMQATLDADQKQLAKYTITAPVSGQLTMNVAINDKVDTNTLIATITTPSKSVVRVNAPVSGIVSNIYTSSLVNAGQQLLKFDTKALEDNIAAQKLKVDEAQTNLQNQKDMLDKLKVYAPIDGLVVVQNAKEGQDTSSITSSTSSTSTSTSAKVSNIAATIINYDKMEVDMPVDELDINKIQIGQKAIITSDALPNQQFEGEVSSINQEGTSQNGVTNFTVGVVFDKVEGMKSGMTADVEIIAQQKDNIIIVPIEAVIDRNGQKFVMIYSENNNNAANTGSTQNNPMQNNFRPVKTGISNESYIEITEGLQEGERIIVPSTSSQNGNNNTQMRIFGIPGVNPSGGQRQNYENNRQFQAIPRTQNSTGTRSQ